VTPGTVLLVSFFIKTYIYGNTVKKLTERTVPGVNPEERYDQ